MDLSQTKLSKGEWESIEVPVLQDELAILKMICNGYHDVMIRHNTHLSLLGYLKIQYSESMEDYLYKRYFQEIIDKHRKIYDHKYAPIVTSKKTIKKADQIRIENIESKSRNFLKTIFEYVLLDIIHNLLKTYSAETKKWNYYYYTLYHISRYNIIYINKYISEYCIHILSLFKTNINNVDLILKSDLYIEKNKYLLKYADITLYEHQKQLFTVCKKPNPKLVLYIAPTGTGKTLSPIGLSEKFKVIFVCAARHVGLALAKAAISCEKKVAFAFGCKDPGDIRLHYFAAKEYVKNRRSGSIFKVDNSIGDRVEIMICDLESYIPAMHYMRSFNDVSNLIMYWDEPTITMDYQHHELHDTIQRNWQNNIIPNVILSSATLPKQHEICGTIAHFRSKFSDSIIENIVSHDCKKTIPIINKDGYMALPHMMFPNFKDLAESIEHCKENKTLLRYMDLKVILRFISYMTEKKLITKNKYEMKRYFPELSDITMNRIKEYYLELLSLIKVDDWEGIYSDFQGVKKKRLESVAYMTTKDSHTFTDGPTIFLADDIEKIAMFCLKSAKIPNVVIQDIEEAIEHNNTLNEQILELEKEVEFKEGSAKKESSVRDSRVNVRQRSGGQDKLKEDIEVRELKKRIQRISDQFKTVALSHLFVPNKPEHKESWMTFDSLEGSQGNEFTCDISEKIVEQIMKLTNVSDSWKILLLMGIGVFTNHENKEYTEIMKRLAEEQKLYLIIASTDYIYGTNYQFCHGYIGKDLAGLSQEKIIQSMGRIGRNNIQQDYTLRFRDDGLIHKLFKEEKDKPEVINMNRLFSE